MKKNNKIKKNLFVCNTPFQIMMAVLFRMTILSDERIDLIISNIIYNSESLYKNIKKSNVFDNVYYIRDYELNYNLNSSNYFKRIKRDINSNKIITKLIPDLGEYDCLYTTDTLYTINCLYGLLKKRNKDLKVYYYEEGPISVICDHGKHFKDPKEYNSLRKNIYNTIVGITNINGHFSGAYTTVSEYMKERYFPWYDMPIISNDKLQDYVNILNNFWEYKKNKQLENKIIFLEESFYIDGKENKDIQIVDDICRIVDKNRVLIKLHPRTRDNRFEKLGVKCFSNNSTPWELISLNGDMRNTILVCMGSGAIIHPQLYWGINQKAIALINCSDYHFSFLDSEYYKCFSKVCEEKKLAYMPSNKKTFLEILKNT